MLPQSFEQANFTFTKPQGWTDEECMDLHVHKGQYPNGTPTIISYWKPNKEDLEALNNGGGIYLEIIGQGMPPVALFTENPFVQQPAVTADGEAE
jgi:hypothetical protein